MIGQILVWWLAITLLGLAATPITWRIFGRLPDRGYGFSRVFGLMVASYLLWIGASLGLLKNTLGGAVAVSFLLIGIGIWVGANRRREIAQWFQEQRTPILVMEILFFVAFFFWSFVRANNPEITGTEKPMELAFINGILSSTDFPPRDPWLSGYTISYYYFGYVQIAFLTRLTGVFSGYAFNLANSLWFGLSVLGTYSILFNLMNRRGEPVKLSFPLLGPIFVLISGNLEGFLEMLHSRKVFWFQQAEGGLASTFWRWLDIKTLVEPPLSNPTWIPARHWWWWRASRVVNDVNLAGVQLEVIDEFPFFSFLLADNHPHLLALPFVLLSVAFALNIFLAGEREDTRFGAYQFSDNIRNGGILGGLLAWLIFIAVNVSSTADNGAVSGGALFSILKAAILGGLIIGSLMIFILIMLGQLPSPLTKSEFWLGSWIYGGLIFLNTWDYPMYLALFIAVIWWITRKKALIDSLKHIVVIAIGITVGGVLLYLPWYPSFASQAGGVLPNVIFPTKFRQFLVMFGTSFVPIFVWLIDKLRNDWKNVRVRWLIVLGLGIPIGLLLVNLLLTAMAAGVLQSQEPVDLQSTLSGLGASGVGEVYSALVERRLKYSWTALVLGFMLAASGVLLWRGVGQKQSKKEKTLEINPFVLMIIVIGGLLILGPEFVYLKDQFGTRMNTIFKFYFTAWILWGLAAAYVSFELWPKRFTLVDSLRLLVFIPLIMGLFYPMMSLWTKTNGFNPSTGRTLDGTEFLARIQPADYSAIAWINDQLREGVISEAVGGSYTYAGRVSTHTNLDTVLGWPGHESQWRGGAAEQGSRGSDLQRLYQTRDWVEAKSIMDTYQIDYVFLGDLERTTYNPIDDSKFRVFMDVIYENESVQIFARSDEAIP